MIIIEGHFKMSVGNDVALMTNKVYKSFPGVVALKGVDFELKKGEVLGLVGENGSGKSTLMKVLSGAYKMDSGQVFLFGKAINIKNPRHAKLLGIQEIYQELSLIDALSVAENIFLGELMKNSFGTLKWSEVYNMASELLKSFNLDINPKTPLGALNIAQKQLVEIIKAVSLECKILLMDEPSSVLGADELKVLFQLIRRLAHQGTSIVYISHRISEAFEITDRITVMRDGVIVGTEKTSNLDHQKLATMMIGRSIKSMFPAREKKQQNDDNYLELFNMFDTKYHPEPISISIRKGEVLGVLGLTGAGKSELFKLIFKSKKSVSGKVKIGKKTLRRQTPLAAIKQGVAYLSEDRKKNDVFLDIPVPQNITASSIYQITGIFGKLLNGKEKNIAYKYINELQIKVPNFKMPIANLSGGNQQKVALAKWLSAHSKVFILDEPTKGIDIATKAHIYKIIHELRKRGCSIVLISSELPEVLGMSDRILVMYRGRAVNIYKNDDSLDQEALVKAYISGTPSAGGINND